MSAGSDVPEERRRNVGCLYVAGAVVVALLAATLALGLLTKHRRLHNDLSARIEQQRRGPLLSYATVGDSRNSRVVELTGDARAFYTTTVYAKVAGYLDRIFVDIGDRVSANQLLATISAPELDQQYRAAVRDEQIKRLTAQRFESLVPSGAVSRQDADSAVATARIAAATVAQYAFLRSYERAMSPFAGTVTARFADPGALIQNATSGQPAALPIVRVSDIDTLRVFVFLAQSDAVYARPGDLAEINLVERPGVHARATVTRLADEIDPRTRTLLTEIDVDNRDRRLLAGGFVHVSIQLQVPSYPEMPSAALVFRDNRPYAAVIDPDDRVRFRAIVVNDDDGKMARVSSGLNVGARVALSVDDSVADGARVRSVPAEPGAVGAVGVGERARGGGPGATHADGGQ